MTINYKEWNLRNLGHLIILGLIITVVIGVMHLVVSPLLMALLPMVFTTTLTLTDTLLFLVLITLLVHRT